MRRGGQRLISSHISSLLNSQILLIHHKLPSLRTIVQYTGLPPLSDQRRLHKSHGKHILSWEELSEVGKALPDNKLGRLNMCSNQKPEKCLILEMI